MKKILSLVGLLCLAVSTWGQANDPVVMRIAGQNVTRSEFEYNYNKNNTESVVDRESVEQYAERFINYKLKIKAALDDKLDTLSSFQQEFRTYRDQQIRPLLVPEGAVEQEVRKYYDGMKAQLGGKDLRLPAHIFLRLPQSASDAEKAQAKTRIDSIYAALKAGASFEELARKHSQDPRTAAQGGLIQWIGPGNLIKEVEDVIYQLRDSGEVAPPMLSTVGYHILQLRGRKDLEPYSQLHDQIQRYLDSRGLAQQLEQTYVDSLAKRRNITVEQMLDEETERLCKTDLELRYLVQEYHDGLLLFEECSRNVWGPASQDTLAIQAYFQKNQKAYAWEQPHYYGMVYYCKDAKDVKKVAKLLKKNKNDEAMWTRLVRDAFNKDSVMVRMEMKLFALGDNGYVDSLALKQKKVNVRPRKDYPYVGVSGRLLKKGPGKWTDVSGQVVNDYQQACDDKFAEELRKRYQYEVYPDVLKTVNKH